MSSLRTQLYASAAQSNSVRQPRTIDPSHQSLHATLTNSRDLADHVSRWHAAARFQLTRAHLADQKILRLQANLATVERSLGRVSPVLVGVGTPLMAFGQALHWAPLAQGALSLLGAGLAGVAVWATAVVGIRRQVGTLTKECAQARDLVQDYTRLAAALDPVRGSATATATQLSGLTPPRNIPRKGSY